MSKTSQCIQMLEILYSRDIVSIAELAVLLETNPRNIPEYKRELESAGYIIDSTRGRYGGYSLSRKSLFPAVALTGEEKDGLTEGYEYLRKRQDFLRKEDYSRAMFKLSSALRLGEGQSELLVASRFPLAMPEEELSKRYLTITECIDSQTAVEMEYLSRSNESSLRVLHPYKLFMFNNAWFVIGFDERSEDFRYFKLNRIQALRPTGKPFRIKLTYNERDYLDEYGMKQNGEWYPIRLRLGGRYAMLVKERIYGKNQRITPEGKDSTLLEVEMQNKEDILHFVLGFGAYCQVLAPEWLKAAIAEETKKLELYYGE